MTHKSVLAVAAAAFLAIGSLCGPASADDDEIVVGIAASQSGFMLAFSGPSALGAKMAIDDINARGGLLGQRISIIESDAKSIQEESAKAALDVINAGADMVIVDCDFDWGGPGALMAQNAGLISFFLCAEDAKAGPAGIGPHAFTAGNAAHAQGSTVAQWGYHEKGYRNFYLLLDDIAQYNKSVCNGFRWAAESLDGLNIVGFDSFQNNDPSVQAQIDRMRSISEPIDAIVLCSFVPGGASVIKQIRDNGIDTPILTDGAMDGNFWIDAVPNIDEVYVTAIGSVYGDDPDPKVEAFMDRFEEHYGERPATGYALPGYALIEMWALAVENAGTVETEPVVEALENLRDIETVAGPRSYSKDLHIQNKVRYLMIGWHNGEHKIEGYWTTGPIPVEVLLAN
jgi:branched-chain amino acid transport system substrate-binding protein